MAHRSPSAEKLSIDGPAGAIEALLEVPENARTDAVAVCCHPHPLYGGTMQNKVVHTLARAAQDQRVATLRFNFRGVGGSAGRHDEGGGESEDAAVVADWGGKRLGAKRLWALGFSFGAFVAYRLATERRAALLVTVAPPVRRFDFGRLPVPACPWLVPQGDADDLVDLDALTAWTKNLDPPPDVRILPGAEHFFHGRLTQLRALVGEWLGDKGVRPL
jgi:alpha/beta superfamily hydrolase